MPKGTGLPPPGTDEAAVMAPITRLLGALQTKGGAAILAAIRAEGGATAAMELADRKRIVPRVGWAEFAARLATYTDRYRERLSDPAIEIDSDLAMVWAPYTVLKNGAVDHCGFDHFDMVRENGARKVLNITWPQRKTGCAS
jgi:hypothetical protein